MIRRSVNSPDYRFATVDTTNEPKVLKTSGLDCQKLVDIHDHYKVWGSKEDKESHVDLAVSIINPYYTDIKTECEKNKLVWHRAWVNRLDEYDIQTMAKEAYTCYKMFKRIVDMRKCLLPKDGEGSSHKQSSGGKRHRK
ncbi:ubiquitin-conjugating enzyme e2 26 [Hordeum vulgare]|nr:ubiquitin-conjugating enzyme e2 26 [Hordeum vulgare]